MVELELGPSSTRKAVPLQEEEVTLETLAAVPVVDERVSQDVPLIKDQSDIKPDTEGDANLQEAVENEGLDQETNNDHNVQPQHVISDKVDNQKSDQVFDQATEVVFKPEEGSTTNFINPGSFLIHSLNETDDLVNEPSERTNLRDKFADESTRDLMYEFNQVPSAAMPGKVDLKKHILDLDSGDPATHELPHESESDDIKQREYMESVTAEEQAVDFDERDLIVAKRPNSDAANEAVAREIVEVRLGEQAIKEGEVKLGSEVAKVEEKEQDKSKVELVRLGATDSGVLSIDVANQTMGLDPSTSIHQNPPISEQPQKDSTSLEKDEKIVISEPREIGEAETISNTIENKVEETTTTTATDTKGENVKIQHSSESFTEKVPNLFQLKYESEKKQNQVLDILQRNLEREEIDDADENTVEAENNVETTTLNRRLPEFYPGTNISININIDINIKTPFLFLFTLSVVSLITISTFSL